MFIEGNNDNIDQDTSTSITIIYQHVIDDSSQNVEGPALTIFNCSDRLVGQSIIQNVERPLTKPAMMTKFLPKILLKKFEHHSERWETTEKACNNDEIPPKDLVEEGWASFITLRDHWQSLQWWRNFSQRSCWVELTSDKDSNDDKIPPKDLFEEVWASFRTLRDHCRLCQWSLKVLSDALSHQPDKNCWRWLELVPKRSVVYSLPPTWQKQLQMIGAGPKMFWCLLSSTNLLLLISTSPSHLLSPPSTFWLMLCPTNLSKAVEDGQGWNHLSHADRWSWLRSKYLGQRYTIL